jgi:hypothetical protein
MARKRVSENPIVVSTGAAATPVRRKSTTPKRVAHTVGDPVEIESAVVPVEPVAEVLSPESPVLPCYQEISALAYSYWVARGYQPGSPEEDWLRAECELSAK